MMATAIGLAVMWLVVALKGSEFKVQGLTSILLMLFLSWGLGSLVMPPFAK